MEKLLTIKTIITSLILFFMSVEAQAIIVHTSDFISDGSRTNFNGFEGISVDHYLSNTYTEDGITVQQINGDSDIWTRYHPPEGQRGWYPSQGDYGYTEIRMADGSDFGDVGLFAATAAYEGESVLLFDLLKDGVSVLSGIAGPLQQASTGYNYFGFEGGGFDTIRLADTYDNGNENVYDGKFQTLAIDAIELSKELPSGPVSVSIDIKPGSYPNAINVHSKGKIPVAILTTEDFDASMVDASTAKFGPGEAQPVHYAIEDVDGDGDWDLILHFNTQEAAISCVEEATLTGQTIDEPPRLIEGTDSVKPVGCNK